MVINKLKELTFSTKSDAAKIEKLVKELSNQIEAEND